MKSEKPSRSPILKNAVLLLFLVLLISCTKEKRDSISGRNNDTTYPVFNSNVKDTGKITYLALGDSYTFGASVSEADKFPNQLVSLLRNEGIKVEDPDIVAVSGWTTGELLSALKSNPPKSNYSFVTLLIGVNNQYQERPLEEYKTQFSELLSLAINYAANRNYRVFVLSIPDYSVTPFGKNYDTAKTAEEINEFNNANFLISKNAGVNYLDITPISRQVKNDASLVAGDGLHPSASQYLKWDQRLAPMVINALGK